MNALISTLQPLPSVLQRQAPADPARPTRRHRVGDFSLRAECLEHFNQLIATLHHAPFDCDQIATASRELAQQPPRKRYPQSVEQRLEVAAAVERMLADPAWETTSNALAPAHLVLDYVRCADHLIPESMPVFGHLDDAILVDTAWPRLSAEIDDYLDYCRLRVIEAELRGCNITQFPFDRDDWRRERQAEAALIAHCRKRGASSYLPTSASRFFRVC